MRRLEAIVDGEVVIIPIEDEKVRRALLWSLLEKFKSELVIKYDGRIICVSRNET